MDEMRFQSYWICSANQKSRISIRFMSALSIKTEYWNRNGIQSENFALWTTTKIMIMSDNCIECSAPVTNRQEGLLCDGCGKWNHRTCHSGVSRAEYRATVHEDRELAWRCRPCQIYSGKLAIHQKYIPCYCHLIKFILSFYGFLKHQVYRLLAPRQPKVLL